MHKHDSSCVSRRQTYQDSLLQPSQHCVIQLPATSASSSSSASLSICHNHYHHQQSLSGLVLAYLADNIDLFTLFIQWQRLCHTGWRCSMLSFRLFQIGATNFAVIFSANCLIHLIAFIICCHPLVTLKSLLGLEEQPHILDPVTVLTATIFHSSCPYKIQIGLYHYPWFIFSIALHFISCLVLYCFVVQCIIVCLAFWFLAFSL